MCTVAIAIALLLGYSMIEKKIVLELVLSLSLSVTARTICVRFDSAKGFCLVELKLFVCGFLVVVPVIVIVVVERLIGTKFIVLRERSYCCCCCGNDIPPEDDRSVEGIQTRRRWRFVVQPCFVPIVVCSSCSCSCCYGCCVGVTCY